MDALKNHFDGLLVNYNNVGEEESISNSYQDSKMDISLQFSVDQHQSEADIDQNVQVRYRNSLGSKVKRFN